MLWGLQGLERDGDWQDPVLEDPSSGWQTPHPRSSARPAVFRPLAEVQAAPRMASSGSKLRPLLPRPAASRKASPGLHGTPQPAATGLSLIRTILGSPGLSPPED